MSTKERSLESVGESAAASIVEMVEALECDYDRLEELRQQRAAVSDSGTGDDLDLDEEEELAELEKAAGECESRDEAEQRIHEDALSVEVRSGWHAPGNPDGQIPEEFCLLLGIGGPAVRIRGELSMHCEPVRAWLEVQDWGTPWTQYFNIDQDTLLTYARCFYFGEG